MCRNFIWSMTSWRRGHMCQQHLITTQPSRPSKAQSVQWLQLFCTQQSSRRGRCGPHNWFLFFEDLALWLQGSLPPPVLPCLSKIDVLPKTSTLVLLLFSMFPLFCLVLSSSRVCVLFTSPALIFLAESKDWPWVRFLSLTLTDVNSQRRQR